MAIKLFKNYGQLQRKKIMLNLKKLLEDMKEVEPESSESEHVPSKEELIKWISKNLNFEDEKLHAWVEDNKWDIHEVEDMIYELASEHVKECMKEKKNEEE